VPTPVPSTNIAQQNDPGWKTWEVAGHTCDVYDPPQLNEHGYTLIFLHDESLETSERDGSRLAGRRAFESLFDQHGLRVICPRGGRCWWSDRDTPEFPAPETAEHFVHQTLLSAIESKYTVAPPQLGLFGIGMGGQGALRISYRHPNVFPVVVGLAPELDYHTRIKGGDEVLFNIYGDTESARQDTAILYIHTLNWPRHQFFCADPESRTFEGADLLRMKMASIGIMFECDLETKPANKSAVDYADHMADAVVGFMVERLNKERLRIV